MSDPIKNNPADTTKKELAASVSSSGSGRDSGNGGNGNGAKGNGSNDSLPPQGDRDSVVEVRLQRGNDFSDLTDQDLMQNTLIRHLLGNIGFPRYKRFLDNIACTFIPQWREQSDGGLAVGARIAPQGVLAYDALRLATEAFLLTGGGIYTGEQQATQDRLEAQLAGDKVRFGRSPDYASRVLTYLGGYLGGQGSTPYLELIAEQLALSAASAEQCRLEQLYVQRWQAPVLLELIWSYWHEEGMLCQSMNAIGIRFQNRRSRPGSDPLAALELDPLQPLNNLLWGWIQSEYRRLSVQRRAYEYDHHYGITLLGKAVPPLQSADSRSKFLESFHGLLATAQRYYDDASNTTVVPEAFPLLNALRDTHLVLAEGAHNQYGDMPWTARVEMMIEQWMLSRPEMLAFLRGRAMVPYQEPWMGQVDTMKKLQGWTDVSVTHFHTLAVCGEALLLAVRHGPWADIGTTQGTAAAWAVFWKPEVQRYLHAYKAVTGVDLTLEPPNNTLPARLLSRRLAEQRRTASLR